MRRVTRGSCPAVLSGPNSLGGVERTAASAFFTDPANHNKNFQSFSTYRHQDVRAALDRMFNGKCCYCESAISHVGPSDIEHYRPKAEVADCQGVSSRPAYYWLAADWGNLLSSCIDCNRSRYQIDGSGGFRMSGKGNRFPLVDESKRAKNPGDELLEEPLLLNPCLDSVEEFFEFVTEGVIRPAHLSGPERDRASSTIAILGLDRHALTKRRGAKMLRVEAAIRKYRESVRRLQDHPTEFWAIERVEEEISEIKHLWGDEDEYSTMVKKQILESCPESADFLG